MVVALPNRAKFPEKIKQLLCGNVVAVYFKAKLLEFIFFFLFSFFNCHRIWSRTRGKGDSWGRYMYLWVVAWGIPFFRGDDGRGIGLT